MQNLVPLPEVAEKVVLAVEIACASSTKLAGTEFLITEKLGITLQDVAEMRYREGEYPGEFTVKTRDGQRTIAAVLRGRRRVQTSQDAPLPRLRRLVVRSRRRLHFRRRSQHLCQQPERGEAASAIHRDDANGAGRKDRAGGGSTRPRDGHGQRLSSPRTISGCSGSGSATPPLPRRMPNRVPTPPVDYEETETLLTDTEVIDRMSHHMRIMPSRPERPVPAGVKKTPVTIGLDVTSAREIVWRPPGDKAIAQRAAFAAALSDGTSTLHNVPHSDDIEGNLGILRQLGVDIWEAADTSYVIGGRGLRGLKLSEKKIDLEPGQFGDDRAHPDGSPCRHAAANFASTATNCCAGVRCRGSSSRCARREPTSSTKSRQGRLPTHHSRIEQLGAINHQVDVFSAQPVSALLFAGLQSSGETVDHPPRQGAGSYRAPAASPRASRSRRRRPPFA